MNIGGIGTGYLTDGIYTSKDQKQQSWETQGDIHTRENGYVSVGKSNRMLNGMNLDEVMEKARIKSDAFQNMAFGNSSDKVSSEDTEESEMDYRQFIQKYVQDLAEKIENGETEVSYQIGGNSFTLKEWDELLEKFDLAEDAMKKLLEEEIEKRIKAEQAEVITANKAGESAEVSDAIVNKAEESVEVSDAQIDMLVSDTIQARFSMEDIYLIAIDKNGIRCSKPGQEEYVWEILFTDGAQYEKAIEFLNDAGQFMDNFLFAAHENFWEDYLNGNMDADAFKEFLEGTDNGIPDYSLTVGDSMYVDKEKIQWAQYMNPLGVKFYTAEEMAQMQAEKIQKNAAKLTKIEDSYSEIYKKAHPEYKGERIFCEYPGGTLYTADEIMQVMERNRKDANYQAAARK